MPAAQKSSVKSFTGSYSSDMNRKARAAHVAGEKLTGSPANVQKAIINSPPFKEETVVIRNLTLKPGKTMTVGDTFPELGFGSTSLRNVFSRSSRSSTGAHSAARPR
jgi:hypothetical protein